MCKANGYTNTCLHTSIYTYIHRCPHTDTSVLVTVSGRTSFVADLIEQRKCMMLKSFKTSVPKSELSAGVLLIIKTVIHSILMGPLSFHEVIQIRKIDNLSIHKILNKTYSFV